MYQKILLKAEKLSSPVDKQPNNGNLSWLELNKSPGTPEHLNAPFQYGSSFTFKSTFLIIKSI